MPDSDPSILAVELTTRIMAARVAAAAGRPNAAEGREACGYFREVLAEVRRGLGLPAPAEQG
jgi:hypothetical protein